MSAAARRWIVAALAIGHLLLAGAYSVWNPLGEAPDEADHFAFVTYIGRNWALPEGTRVTQSKHPPFYHATAAALAALGAPADNRFFRANPDVSFTPADNWSPNFFIHTRLEAWPWQDGSRGAHLARLWSVLLSTAAVLACYGLLATAFPEHLGVALTATGVLAFLPEFAFIGGSVNNDNAAALFGTLSLWGGLAIYRGGGRWRPGWWTPVALGVGLLAKVSTSALWPVVGLAIVLGAAREQAQIAPGTTSWVRSIFAAWRRWLITGLIVFIPAVLIAMPWLLRNWRLYGDLLGMELVRQTVDQRTQPWAMADTVWLLKGWFVSFWGKFGGAGHIPMPGWIYWGMAAMTGVAVTGCVRAWWLPGWRARRTELALLALAVVAVAVGIWRYSLLALGTDQGRLLYPALAALVGLFVVGLAAWTPPRLAHTGAIVLVFGMLCLGIYGLVGVIRPAFARPEPVAALDANATGVEPVGFGELALAGWSLAEQPILYWEATTQPTQDWRTNLRVVAEDGSLAWEWRRSPGYGRWSTDWWPEGTLLRDEYRVVWPEWAGPGRYLVEVGLYPEGGELVVPPSASAEHPYVTLGWLERRPSP